MIWGKPSFLRVDGVSLEVATHGPRPDEAPTLVMLHEGLGCVALWRDWPAQLAALTGYGVMVYSRAGYGRSDPTALPWPLDYLTRHALDILPKVLEPLKQIVLLGHSDGATIAAIYAGRIQDPRLFGTILMAPHFFAEPIGLASIAAARDAYDAGNLRDKLAVYHDHVDCAFRGWCDSWLDPEFRGWSVRDVLATAPVPVLAIQGDQDPYGSLAQIDAIVQDCPLAQRPLILPGVKHAPHQDAQVEVEGRIVDFLRTVRDVAE